MQTVEAARTEFFSDCTLVVRAPGCFFLTGDHSVEFGQPAVVVAVNSWAYVGIRKRRQSNEDFVIKYVDPAAPINHAERLDPSKHYFGSERQNKPLAKSLNLLKAGLREWRKDTRKAIPQFKIWTDVPFAVGLNAGPAIAACLGLLLYAKEKNIGEDMLRELDSRFQSQSHDRLEGDQDFVRVFQLACWCDALLRSHPRCGAQVYSSLVRTRDDCDLLLYFTETLGTPPSAEIVYPKLDSLPKASDQSESKIFALRFKAPAWFKTVNRMSLIYSGNISDPDAVLKEMDSKHRHDVREIREELRKRFGKPLKASRRLASPLASILSGRISNADLGWPQDLYTQTLGMISWRIIDLLFQEFDRTEEFTKRLIDHNRMLSAYGVLKDPLKKFKREFRSNGLPRELSENTWAKLIGPGNGGDLMVFGAARNILEVNNHLERRRAEDESYFPLIHCTSADDAVIAPADIPAVCDFSTHTEKREPRGMDSGGLGSKITLKRSAEGFPELLVKAGGKQLILRIRSPLYIELIDLFAGTSDSPRPVVNVFDVAALQADFHKRNASDKRSERFKSPIADQRLAHQKATTFLDNFVASLRKGKAPELKRDSLLVSKNVSKQGGGYIRAWQLSDNVSLHGFYMDASEHASWKSFDESIAKSDGGKRVRSRGTPSDDE
jgi:hypothetical protein